MSRTSAEQVLPLHFPEGDFHAVNTLAFGLLAALVLPLCLAAPASAATSSQSNGAGTVLYNAGDHDLTYGPDTFVIRDFRMQPARRAARVFLEGWIRPRNGKLRRERVISLAELGPNLHTLRWQSCPVDMRDPFRLTQCKPYVGDVVFSG